MSSDFFGIRFHHALDAWGFFLNHLPFGSLLSPGLAKLYFALVVTLFGLVSETPALQDATQPPDSQSGSQPWRPSFGSSNESSTNGSQLSGPAAGTTSAPAQDEFTSRGNADERNPSGTAKNSTERGTLNDPREAPAGRFADNNDVTGGTGITRITRSMEQLPNTAGQVWREYDISPYTSRITNHLHPQQAVIDWILKETGSELWFHQPMGILNATPHQLFVYHTPEVQNSIRQLVDRFVYTQGQIQRIEMTLMTIDNPNWRTSAYRMLQPIETQSPGVEAWVISKENAAMLQGQLVRRIDAKLVNSGSITNHEGQSFSVSNLKPTQYVAGLQWFANQVPNYQPQLASINEGYSITISCLSGIDGRSIEAIVKCEIDQIEQLTNVNIDVPGTYGNQERMGMQVPRIISWRFNERFRWANDQVLLLSCGVVSKIEPDQPNRINIPILSNNLKTRRADALLFIEFRGPANDQSLPAASNAMVPIRK